MARFRWQKLWLAQQGVWLEWLKPQITRIYWTWLENKIQEIMKLKRKKKTSIGLFCNEVWRATYVSHLKFLNTGLEVFFFYLNIDCVQCSFLSFMGSFNDWLGQLKFFSCCLSWNEWLWHVCASRNKLLCVMPWRTRCECYMVYHSVWRITLAWR